MSLYAVQLRSYSPDVLVEFDLPPGSHARIGGSEDAEVTLPLENIAPVLCTLGRFQDGRMYMADTDGAISQRVDLPTTLSFPPYRVVVSNPGEAMRNSYLQGDSSVALKPAPLLNLSWAVGIMVVLAAGAALAVYQCERHDFSATKVPPAAPVTTPQAAKPQVVTPVAKPKDTAGNTSGPAGVK